MNIERRYLYREQFYGVLKMVHYSQDYKFSGHEARISFQMEHVVGKFYLRQIWASNSGVVEHSNVLG